MKAFDYSIAVDWALEEMMNGRETENILILSSFSKPIEKIEIENYVSAALEEINQSEFYETYSLKANIHFHVKMILNGFEVKKNLSNLKDIAINNDFAFEITPFYLIYHALDSFNYDNIQFYYDGLTRDNWPQILKQEAIEWVQTHIENKRPYVLSSLDEEVELATIARSYELSKGEYKIYILGGWYVRPGEFEIELVNRNTKRRVDIKEAVFKEQSFMSGKRAKHFWTFKIGQNGIYTMKTSKSFNLKVKHHNLAIVNLIFKKPNIDHDIIRLRIIKR